MPSFCRSWISTRTCRLGNKCHYPHNDEIPAKSDEIWQVAVSINMSNILRHSAQKRNIQISPNGYVKIVDMLQDGDFVRLNVTMADVHHAVRNNSKQRFELSSCQTLIRCVQGHSMQAVKENDLLTQLITPPPQAIHGTYGKAWLAIRAEGLRAMERNHIHFAEELCAISGMRYNCEVAIYVDARKMMSEGMLIYRAKNGVILSSGLNGVIAPSYFTKVVNLATGKELSITGSANYDDDEISIAAPSHHDDDDDDDDEDDDEEEEDDDEDDDDDTVSPQNTARCEGDKYPPGSTLRSAYCAPPPGMPSPFPVGRMSSGGHYQLFPSGCDAAVIVPAKVMMSVAPLPKGRDVAPQAAGPGFSRPMPKAKKSGILSAAATPKVSASPTPHKAHLQDLDSTQSTLTSDVSPRAHAGDTTPSAPSRLASKAMAKSGSAPSLTTLKSNVVPKGVPLVPSSMSGPIARKAPPPPPASAVAATRVTPPSGFPPMTINLQRPRAPLRTFVAKGSAPSRPRSASPHRDQSNNAAGDKAQFEKPTGFPDVYLPRPRPPLPAFVSDKTSAQLRSTALSTNEQETPSAGNLEKPRGFPPINLPRPRPPPPAAVPAAPASPSVRSTSSSQDESPSAKADNSAPRPALNFPRPPPRPPASIGKTAPARPRSASCHEELGTQKMERPMGFPVLVLPPASSDVLRPRRSTSPRAQSVPQSEVATRDASPPWSALRGASRRTSLGANATPKAAGGAPPNASPPWSALRESSQNTSLTAHSAPQATDVAPNATSPWNAVYARHRSPSTKEEPKPTCSTSKAAPPWASLRNTASRVNPASEMEDEAPDEPPRWSSLRQNLKDSSSTEKMATTPTGETSALPRGGVMPPWRQSLRNTSSAIERYGQRVDESGPNTRSPGSELRQSPPSTMRGTHSTSKLTEEPSAAPPPWHPHPVNASPAPGYSRKEPDEPSAFPISAMPTQEPKEPVADESDDDASSSCTEPVVSSSSRTVPVDDASSRSSSAEPPERVPSIVGHAESNGRNVGGRYSGAVSNNDSGRSNTGLSNWSTGFPHIGVPSEMPMGAYAKASGGLPSDAVTARGQELSSGARTSSSANAPRGDQTRAQGVCVLPGIMVSTPSNNALPDNASNAHARNRDANLAATNGVATANTAHGGMPSATVTSARSSLSNNAFDDDLDGVPINDPADAGTARHNTLLSSSPNAPLSSSLGPIHSTATIDGRMGRITPNYAPNRGIVSGTTSMSNTPAPAVATGFERYIQAASSVGAPGAAPAPAPVYNPPARNTSSALQNALANAPARPKPPPPGHAGVPTPHKATAPYAPGETGLSGSSVWVRPGSSATASNPSRPPPPPPASFTRTTPYVAGSGAPHAAQAAATQDGPSAAAIAALQSFFAGTVASAISGTSNAASAPIVSGTPVATPITHRTATQDPRVAQNAAATAQNTPTLTQQPTVQYAAATSLVTAAPHATATLHATAVSRAVVPPHANVPTTPQIAVPVATPATPQIAVPVATPATPQIAAPVATRATPQMAVPVATHATSMAAPPAEKTVTSSAPLDNGAVPAPSAPPERSLTIREMQALRQKEHELREDQLLQKEERRREELVREQEEREELERLEEFEEHRKRQKMLRDAEKAEKEKQRQLEHWRNRKRHRSRSRKRHGSRHRSRSRKRSRNADRSKSRSHSTSKSKNRNQSQKRGPSAAAGRSKSRNRNHKRSLSVAVDRKKDRNPSHKRSPSHAVDRNKDRNPSQKRSPSAEVRRSKSRSPQGSDKGSPSIQGSARKKSASIVRSAAQEDIKSPVQKKEGLNKIGSMLSFSTVGHRRPVVGTQPSLSSVFMPMRSGKKHLSHLEEDDDSSPSQGKTPAKPAFDASLDVREENVDDVPNSAGSDHKIDDKSEKNASSGLKTGGISESVANALQRVATSDRKTRDKAKHRSPSPHNQAKLDSNSREKTKPSTIAPDEPRPRASAHEKPKASTHRTHEKPKASTHRTHEKSSEQSAHQKSSSPANLECSSNSLNKELAKYGKRTFGDAVRLSSSSPKQRGKDKVSEKKKEKKASKSKKRTREEAAHETLTGVTKTRKETAEEREKRKAREQERVQEHARDSRISAALKRLHAIEVDKRNDRKKVEKEAAEKLRHSAKKNEVGEITAKSGTHVEKKEGSNDKVKKHVLKKKESADKAKKHPQKEDVGDKAKRSSHKEGGVDDKAKRPSHKEGGVDDKAKRPSHKEGGVDDKAKRPSHKEGGVDDKAKRPTNKEDVVGDNAKRPTNKEDDVGDKAKRPTNKEDVVGDKAKRPTSKEVVHDKAKPPTHKEAAGKKVSRPAYKESAGDKVSRPAYREDAADKAKRPAYKESAGHKAKRPAEEEYAYAETKKTRHERSGDKAKRTCDDEVAEEDIVMRLSEDEYALETKKTRHKRSGDKAKRPRHEEQAEEDSTKVRHEHSGDKAKKSRHKDKDKDKDKDKAKHSSHKHGRDKAHAGGRGDEHVSLSPSVSPQRKKMPREHQHVEVREISDDEASLRKKKSDEVAHWGWMLPSRKKGDVDTDVRQQRARGRDKSRRSIEID